MYSAFADDLDSEYELFLHGKLSPMLKQNCKIYSAYKMQMIFILSMNYTCMESKTSLE